MTRMTPLLERDEQFARSYTPAPPGPPTAQALIITCLDHRAGPAITLGLRPGEAPGEGPTSMHPHVMQETARQREGNLRRAARQPPARAGSPGHPQECLPTGRTPSAMRSQAHDPRRAAASGVPRQPRPPAARSRLPYLTDTEGNQPP